MSRSLPTQALVASGVVVLGAAFGWWLGTRVASEPVGLDQLRLPTLDGEMSGPAEHPGEVVLLDFWATWCGPCRAQARILEQIYPAISDQVRFFAVNVGEDATTVADFLVGAPMGYPVLLDVAGDRAAEAGIFGLPTVVIIGRDGATVLRSEGITGRTELTEALEQALGRELEPWT